MFATEVDERGSGVLEDLSVVGTASTLKENNETLSSAILAVSGSERSERSILQSSSEGRDHSMSLRDEGWREIEGGDESLGLAVREEKAVDVSESAEQY